MSMLHMQSFENQAITLDAGWGGTYTRVASSPTPKTGANCLMTNSLDPAFYRVGSVHGNKQELIAAFHWRESQGLNYGFFRLTDGTTIQLSVGVSSDGSITVWRGSYSTGVLLGTSAASGLLTLNAWHHIQIKARCDNATGSIEVRINGVTAISLSGVDTQASATNAYFSVVVLAGATIFNFTAVDNFVLLDTAGSVNNDFPGEIELVTLYPSGAGSSTQWTPSAGANHQNVDEVGNHDTDATYNSTDVPGNQDMFAMQNLALTGGSVAAIKVEAFMRKDDVGVREAALVVNLGSSASVRATNALSTSYVNYAEIFESDPADSSALTPTKINAAEIGYVLIS